MQSKKKFSTGKYNQSYLRRMLKANKQIKKIPSKFSTIKLQNKNAFIPK